jgi:hypothetical protein
MMPRSEKIVTPKQNDMRILRIFDEEEKNENSGMVLGGDYGCSSWLRSRCSS